MRPHSWFQTIPLRIRSLFNRRAAANSLLRIKTAHQWQSSIRAWRDFTSGSTVGSECTSPLIVKTSLMKLWVW
jgi:hypothetical protein